MSMEKITKEELLNKLGAHALSDEELETVAGGENQTECLTSCVNKAHGDLDGRALQTCQLSCLK